MSETFYVSSTGNDANIGDADHPLRNIWQALALSPVSDQIFVNCLDAGPFDGAIDPAHRVFGMSIEGAPGKSVVRADTNGTNLLTSQDGATLICSNLSLLMKDGITGCNAGFARQGAILDIDNCDFGAFATH